jgi:hypothetical protein
VPVGRVRAEIFGGPKIVNQSAAFNRCALSSVPFCPPLGAHTSGRSSSTASASASVTARAMRCCPIQGLGRSRQSRAHACDATRPTNERPTIGRRARGAAGGTRAALVTWACAGPGRGHQFSRLEVSGDCPPLFIGNMPYWRRCSCTHKPTYASAGQAGWLKSPLWGRRDGGFSFSDQRAASGSQPAAAVGPGRLSANK